MCFHAVDILPQLCALFVGHLLFAAHFFQFPDQCVSLCARTGNNPLRLLLGALNFTLRILACTACCIFGALLLRVGFGGQTIGIFHLLCKTLTLLLQLADDILKLTAFIRYQFLCTINNRLIHPQAS